MISIISRLFLRKPEVEYTAERDLIATAIVISNDGNNFSSLFSWPLDRRYQIRYYFLCKSFSHMVIQIIVLQVFAYSIIV